MKREFIVIADEECPAIHLLDRTNWEVFQSKENENLFTMVKKTDDNTNRTGKTK